MIKHKQLSRYLKKIIEQYGFQICVKDFIGFIDHDPDLHEVIEPYLIHKSSFCMKVKFEFKLWDICQWSNRNLSRSCDVYSSIFCGSCPLGIGEFSIPIMYNETAIGALCCGSFCFDREKSYRRLRKCAHTHGFDFEAAKVLFDAVVLPTHYSLHEIEDVLGIASSYIEQVFLASKKDYVLEDKRKNKDIISREKYIILTIAEYINLNFSEDITVESMAQTCRCSVSYINHEFKKRMGSNFRSYMNSVRINHAKELLLSSHNTVSDIAEKCGYNDPDYFSQIFKKGTGFTPLSYRKTQE